MENRGFILVPLFLLILSKADAQNNTNNNKNCSRSFRINNEARLYSRCIDLKAQGAKLAWTLFTENMTMETVFTGQAETGEGWVGWGFNTERLAMAGTQALIAFRAPNGSSIVLTYNVTSDVQTRAKQLVPSAIGLHVLNMAVHIDASNGFAIWAAFQLPDKQSAVVNIVWNRGPSVSGLIPSPHSIIPADLATMATVDISSGASVSRSLALRQLKSRHAILNVLSWGILLPLGAMAARYIQHISQPLWFYMHVSIQIIGYILGVAGWGTGLKLGGYSVGVVHKKHRSIGIALFALATLQMCAILVRPSKVHHARRFWNYYHYILGIIILALGIVNIFFGFNILAPAPKWRHAYIGVIAVFAGLAVLLEIATRIHLIKIKKKNESRVSKSNITSSS